MKIDVMLTERTKKAVDVEVPFHRLHHVGDEHESTYFTRVYLGADGELWQLTIHRGCEPCGPREQAWEIESSRFNPLDCSGGDYLLGRGQYACTAEEWEAALAQFKGWLQEKEHAATSR